MTEFCLTPNDEVICYIIVLCDSYVLSGSLYIMLNLVVKIGLLKISDQ
jgi:hypothetical protein